MGPVEYTVKRLQECLEEIGRLKESEFPYGHSKAALRRLEILFETKLARISAFDQQTEPGSVTTECALALEALFNYLPLLGFILRSTNVRNAFECYGPLLRLARTILDPLRPAGQEETRLVLSSEWEYSPFTYLKVPELREFVLMGLPASESANPLLVPIAGHEFGHSVWLHKQLQENVALEVRTQVLQAIGARWDEYHTLFPTVPTVESVATDLFAAQTWVEASEWACSQAEESFCDFVGVGVFGKSYLRAFAYLLSPKCAGARSGFYPKLRLRAANLRTALATYTPVDMPDYETAFEDSEDPSLFPGEAFQLSIADNLLPQLVPLLLNWAHEAVTSAGCVLSSEEEVQRILARFRKLVPAETVLCLADLVNAAWEAMDDPALWAEIPTVRDRRDVVLKDLVLKNMEVFEIEQILGEAQ